MGINFIKRISISLILIILIFSCGNDEDIVSPKPEMGTVADSEGNAYITVKIGDQWWMAEDLRSSKFSNGNSVKYINELDTSEWANTKFPAYSKGIVGNLYNFYTVGSLDNIAPEGWHIATEADWQMLELYLGMSSDEVNKVNWRGSNEGDKLKQDYQFRSWKNFTNVWGTNQSGFAAMPCGCRLFDGRNCFPNTAEQGFWWTSTTSENEAWFRSLDYKKSKIFRYYAQKNYGYAIRCVKNM
jgi:uncharacterized protein (TIGR02145 family)